MYIYTYRRSPPYSRLFYCCTCTSIVRFTSALVNQHKVIDRASRVRLHRIAVIHISMSSPPLIVVQYHSESSLVQRHSQGFEYDASFNS
jgi:hypothetical protein